MVFCNVIGPQVLWFKKPGEPWAMFAAMCVNVGMWFERFVIIITSLPVVAMAEIKTVMPQAHPRTTPNTPTNTRSQAGPESAKVRIRCNPNTPGNPENRPPNALRRAPSDEPPPPMTDHADNPTPGSPRPDDQIYGLLAEFEDRRHRRPRRSADARRGL